MLGILIQQLEKNILVNLYLLPLDLATPNPMCTPCKYQYVTSFFQSTPSMN